ncbi:hypothetical protein [Enterococcus sp. AZ109]|uniref:hypothetical protein n=1 Tax=Enterococcus sp. AZ109 TaxID=2774634 RepID=UPI003F24FA79
MIQQLGTKLQVRIAQEDDTAKKVNFSNIVNNPTEAEIVSLGDVLTELSTEGSILDDIIVTNQTRVTKTEVI